MKKNYQVGDLVVLRDYHDMLWEIVSLPGEREDFTAFFGLRNAKRSTKKNHATLHVQESWFRKTAVKLFKQMPKNEPMMCGDIVRLTHNRLLEVIEFSGAAKNRVVGLGIPFSLMANQFLTQRELLEKYLRVLWIKA